MKKKRYDLEVRGLVGVTNLYELSINKIKIDNLIALRNVLTTTYFRSRQWL